MTKVWVYKTPEGETIRPLPAWWSHPIEHDLRLWAKQRDYWTDQKQKRFEKGHPNLTPTQQAAYNRWTESGWVRRIVLNKQTKTQWKSVEKASKTEVAKHGVAITLKVVELDVAGTYQVLLKAFGSDWQEIECMLVPHVLLTASDEHDGEEDVSEHDGEEEAGDDAEADHEYAASDASAEAILYTIRFRGVPDLHAGTALGRKWAPLQ